MNAGVFSGDLAIATVDLSDPPVRVGAHLDAAAGWIGVDLGIENIAVTSDRALAREFGCLGRGGGRAGIRPKAFYRQHNQRPP